MSTKNNDELAKLINGIEEQDRLLTRLNIPMLRRRMVQRIKNYEYEKAVELQVRRDKRKA